MNRDELVGGRYYWARYVSREGSSEPEIVYYDDDGIGYVDRVGSDEIYRTYDFEFLREVEPYES